MTKSLEQEILDNAPCTTWSHRTSDDVYLKEEDGYFKYWSDCHKEWYPLVYRCYEVRSRKDIEQIIALQNENAELEKELKSYRRDEKVKQKLNKYLGIEVQSD